MANKETIGHCPLCGRLESEAYHKGYTDAFKLLQKEIMSVHLSTPLTFLVNEESYQNNDRPKQENNPTQ